MWKRFFYFRYYWNVSDIEQLKDVTFPPFKLTLINIGFQYYFLDIAIIEGWKN